MRLWKPIDTQSTLLHFAKSQVVTSISQLLYLHGHKSCTLYERVKLHILSNESVNYKHCTCGYRKANQYFALLYILLCGRIKFLKYCNSDIDERAGGI